MLNGIIQGMPMIGGNGNPRCYIILGSGWDKTPVKVTYNGQTHDV